MQASIMNDGLSPVEIQEAASRAVYELGATDQQLADILAVSVQTLHEWYYKFPDFKAAIVAARDRHNSEVLEKSLIKRAQGYDVEEREQGNRGTQDIDIVKTKHVPPDTAALQFFLKLRSPERWKEAPEDKGSELAEIFGMIINKTRTLPATRKPEAIDMTIDMQPASRADQPDNTD